MRQLLRITSQTALRYIAVHSVPFRQFRRVFPVAGLSLLAACGGEVQTPALAAEGEARDTALLTAESVRVGGFVIEPAGLRAWAESYTAPARLSLDPTRTQMLGAIAEGRVTRVLAHVGDRVRAGQLLVAIYSNQMTEAVSALSAARANDAAAASELATAENASSRAERLYELKAASLADLERARSALARANAGREASLAELRRAESMLQHLTGGESSDGSAGQEVLIRSPIDGVVVTQLAQAGSVVLVGAPLVDVSQTNALILRLSIPERALATVPTGAVIRFTVPVLGAEVFEAKVTRVAPTLDATTRTFDVVAQVTTQSDRLRAEMYATAELLGPAAGEMTVNIPVVAVQEFDGDTVVIAARPMPDGVELEALRVRVGQRSPDRAVIVSGLAEGTPIVVEGAAIAKAEILRRREVR
jgi:cobalt-zinc-cadmium efflux system membrane fusion protein